MSFGDAETALHLLILLVTSMDPHTKCSGPYPGHGMHDQVVVVKHAFVCCAQRMIRQGWCATPASTTGASRAKWTGTRG